MDSKGASTEIEDMGNCYSYLEMLGFTSKFLGFGGAYEEDEALGFLQAGVGGTGTRTGTGTGIVQQMSSESSSVSSLSNSSSPTSTATNGVLSLSTSCSKHAKKKQERKEEAIKTNNQSCKKAKSTGTIKVRKEKLGERIMALQQLVSPFGKSDTASVLHEALGYIRFLHDQVQVLSSPYLQHLPSSTPLHEGMRASDLRSRGLCLVPVSCTEHVASASGADLWSPSVRKNNG